MMAMLGTSSADWLRMGARVTEALAKLAFVCSVAERAGRAESTADTHGPHQSEIEVDLKPLSGKAARSAKSDKIQGAGGLSLRQYRRQQDLPYGQPINEMLSGYSAPVAVEVSDGNDLKALGDTARQIAQVLSAIRGAGLGADPSPALPQLTIDLRPADVRRWGFDPSKSSTLLADAYKVTSSDKPMTAIACSNWS